MKIAIIQAPLVWENAEANRNYFADKISGIKADLVLLPEMFSTGFTMKPETVAESMSGETVLWMQSMAMTNNVAMAGSIVIKENGNFYNRLLFVRPTGTIEQYDKRHLFSLAGEDKAYTAGSEKLIVDYQGWKICLLICYDLRFPVFSRNVDEYDLLVYVANWPKPRILAWDTLIKARAIENMSYAIGVNRIGADDNGLEYIGHSQIVDALGNCIISPEENEGIFTAEIDQQSLFDIRKKFAFLNDRDEFTVKPN